jgi:hypothetical protein
VPVDERLNDRVRELRVRQVDIVVFHCDTRILAFRQGSEKSLRDLTLAGSLAVSTLLFFLAAECQQELIPSIKHQTSALDLEATRRPKSVKEIPLNGHLIIFDARSHR